MGTAAIAAQLVSAVVTRTARARIVPVAIGVADGSGVLTGVLVGGLAASVGVFVALLRGVLVATGLLPHDASVAHISSQCVDPQ